MNDPATNDLPAHVGQGSAITAPILFLDIDGVLNVFGQRSESTKRAVAQLHRVIDATGCDIVLSSTWRLFSGGLAGAEKAIRGRLGYDGKPFVGRTPDLRGQPRGLEIAAWIAAQPVTPRRWAVVDDDDDMDFVRHRLVRTHPSIGLDEVGADQLIEMLSGEGKPR